MYTIHIPLTQHTPMIHFQTDQPGHTLKGTELKPKLDKYLCKLFVEEVRPFIAKKGKFEGRGGVFALDYKVRIESSEAERNLELSMPTTLRYTRNNGGIGEDKFPCFFGNLGESEGRAKKFSMHNRLTLVITSRHSALIGLIEKHIGDFLLRHNFGSRQTKGFGSFYPADLKKYILPQSGLYFDLDLRELPRHRFAYAPRPSDQYMRMYRLFDIIRLFYSTLRGGLNMGFGRDQYYFKSLMFLYAKEKLHANWEKKKIKQEFFQRELQVQRNDPKNAGEGPLSYDSKQAYLMRDLLGLSTSQKWYTYGNAQITIECRDKEIARHTSPITFSPVHLGNNNYRVYLFTDEEGVSGILGKKFLIREHRGREFEIETPPIGRFSIADFLNFALDVDIDSHFKTISGNPTEKDQLSNIYNQLGQRR